MENNLAALDPQMPQYMTMAGRHGERIITSALGEQDQPKATQLYFVLNALLEGKAKKLLKKVKDKCGCEVWRLSMDRYEKEEDGRHLGMFQMVLALELPDKMDDVEEAILDWENSTKEYEDQSGLALPQQILWGVLVKQFPEVVRTQVRRRTRM